MEPIRPSPGVARPLRASKSIDIMVGGYSILPMKDSKKEGHIWESHAMHGHALRLQSTKLRCKITPCLQRLHGSSIVVRHPHTWEHIVLDVDILHVDIAVHIFASLLEMFLGRSVYLVRSPFVYGVLLGTLLLDRKFRQMIRIMSGMPIP